MIDLLYGLRVSCQKYGDHRNYPGQGESAWCGEIFAHQKHPPGTIAAEMAERRIFPLEKLKALRWVPVAPDLLYRNVQERLVGRELPGPRQSQPGRHERYHHLV